MANTTGSPARIEAAERRALVMSLRRNRMSFEEIGQRIGTSRERAWRIYQEALAAIPAPHVEEHRAEELLLIDRAIADLLGIAEDHVRPRSAIEAWNSIRGFMERKARLLGLDAPERHELSMTVVDARIAELQSKLSQAIPGEVVDGDGPAALAG